jgi:hypothetical protein
MRQLFTKFRVSDHSLEIESGRYKNITREERIRKNCNLNEIGDEYHINLPPVRPFVRPDIDTWFWSYSFNIF